MIPKVFPFLSHPETVGDAEIFEVILETSCLRVERIVSQGQPTPAGEWYDQQWPEWVLLVQGAARLAYEDGSTHPLHAGQAIHLPAGLRHRVEEVSTDAIWLAIHYQDKPEVC